MCALLASTYAVAGCLLHVARQILRPILYAAALGCIVTPVVSIYASAQNFGPEVWVSLAGPVAILRYLYKYRTAFELQICIYKEAIVAAVGNPLLSLLVPCLEAFFQVYQWYLLIRYVQVCYSFVYMYSSTTFGPIGAEMLLLALTLHQYWTVFSLRAAFEIVCSSALGKYYFRKADPHGNIITWTVQAVLNGFTKSLGTACFFGLVQVPATMMHWIHMTIRNRYNKCSWLAIPVKLMLLALVTIVAILVQPFEALIGISVTYAGITGEGVCSSAKRALATMKDDGVVTISEQIGTQKISAALAMSTLAFSSTLLALLWEPLKSVFGLNYAGTLVSVNTAFELIVLLGNRRKI